MKGGVPGPRLRRDLIFTPVRDGNRRLIEVYDPILDTRRRLSELSYSVAWLMDGRDLSRLRRRIRRDLHVRVTSEALSAFVDQLASAGWFEEEATTVHDTVPYSAKETVALPPSQLRSLLARAR
jgi:hypothetical protein